MNKPYNAEFFKDGIFPESRTSAAVIRTAEEMDGFIAEILEDSRAGGIMPFGDEYDFEGILRDFYSRFDKEFFEKNNLIIALLERGSGSLRFSLDTVCLEGDTLRVTVCRTSPMMQTMDYRTHTMLLSVSKAVYDAPRAEIIINTTK